MNEREQEIKDWSFNPRAMNATGYLKQTDGKTTITDWHGNHLGDAKIVASWSLPRTSWISDRMFQVEATIDGVTYTGRSAGAGMFWRGKVKRSK